MGVESDADRLELVAADGFGTCLRSARGDIMVLLVRQTERAVAGDIEYSASTPYVLARKIDADRLRLARGDVVTVEDRAYAVIAFEPDGTGMTRVRLDEA